MKKFYLFLIALSVSILLIGCNSSNPSSNNTSNNQAREDWPVYDFDTLIEKADVVVFVEADKNEKKEVEGLPATLSTLKVTDVLYGSAPESIILDQTNNIVEPGKSYLLFLNKKVDYYYLTDGNSVIPEIDKMYQVDIPGIEGEYDENQLTKQIEEVNTDEIEPIVEYGEGKADMEGIVLDIRERGIKLARNLSPDEYEEIKNESVTKLHNEYVGGGERESLGLIDLIYENKNEFNKGDEVEVWIDGDIMEIFPERAVAKKIVVKQ